MTRTTSGPIPRWGIHHDQESAASRKTETWNKMTRRAYAIMLNVLGRKGNGHSENKIDLAGFFQAAREAPRSAIGQRYWNVRF